MTPWPSAAPLRLRRGVALPGRAAVALPGGAHAEREVRRAVSEVLSRPEFREAQPSITDQALQWVGLQLNRFLALVSGSGVGRAVSALLLAAVVLAMIVTAVWYLRRLERSGDAGAAAVGPTGRSARDWEADAVAADRAGDLREAIRCHYRALIADLAARGLLDEVPGWTSGQYREVVRTDLAEAFGAFDRATDLFDRAWYGHEPVGPDDLRGMVDAAVRARATAAAARGTGERIGVGA